MKHIKEFNLSENQNPDVSNCLNPESGNSKIYAFWPGQFKDLGDFMKTYLGKESSQGWDETLYEWAFEDILRSPDCDKVMLVMDDSGDAGWITGVYLIDEDVVLGGKNIYGERRFSYGHKIEEALEKDSLKDMLRKVMSYRNKVI